MSFNQGFIGQVIDEFEKEAAHPLVETLKAIGKDPGAFAGLAAQRITPHAEKILGHLKETAKVTQTGANTAKTVNDAFESAIREGARIKTNVSTAAHAFEPSMKAAKDLIAGKPAKKPTNLKSLLTGGAIGAGGVGAVYGLDKLTD